MWITIFGKMSFQKMVWKAFHHLMLMHIGPRLSYKYIGSAILWNNSAFKTP